MRKIFLGQQPGLPAQLQNLFNEIEKASQDGDIVDIGGAYTISGTYTATRTLNVTTPTLANAVAVLATLIADLQSGGSTRST